MKGHRSAKALSINSNYIFYICLSAVLAAAVFGLLTDVAAR